MNKQHVVVRLNTSMERREYHAAKTRGAAILLAYLVLVGIVVWSVLNR